MKASKIERLWIMLLQFDTRRVKIRYVPLNVRIVSKRKSSFETV